MITPTVGRVILVNRFTPELTPVSDQPEPALITYVHNDRSINVGGFSTNGHPFSLTNLQLLQSGDDYPAQGDSYAEWMEYQRVQAAKAAEEEADDTDD